MTNSLFDISNDTLCRIYIDDNKADKVGLNRQD